MPSIQFAYWATTKWSNILQIFKCISLNENNMYFLLKVDWSLPLTHWGRVTHICVGKLTIIASDHGLLPGWRQAIIWTNAGMLLIGPLGTNFNEILIEIHIFSFKKMHLKMSSAKWRPFCLGLNVLMVQLKWQDVNTGSGNGLVPNQRQAITSNNDDPVHWHICTSSVQQPAIT